MSRPISGRQLTPHSFPETARQETTPSPDIAAVINLAEANKNTLSRAKFVAKKPAEVSQTPMYRADIPMLAAMFNYCTDPEMAEGESDKLRDRRIQFREQLHRFLQISVATWARPDAAHDVSVDAKRAQWHSASGTPNLNPKGRAQTKKYRPIIPVARQMAPLLDAHEGFYVEVASVRQAFEALQQELELPGDREAGLKLIRRSMAQLGRRRLGERDWVEGKIFLGHHRPDVSDVYAPFDADYLGRAREVTEQIIDEIIALAPKAFNRTGIERGTNDKPGTGSNKE